MPLVALCAPAPFQGLTVDALYQRRRRAAQAAVAALPPEIFLHKSVRDVTAELVLDHLVRVPRVARQAPHVEREDVTVPWDVAHPIYSCVRLPTRGHRVTFTVPFDGDAELLDVVPSSGAALPAARPAVANVDGVLVVAVERGDADASAFKREYDAAIEQLEAWLDGVAADADAYNATLPGLVAEWVRDRHAAVATGARLEQDLRRLFEE